MHYTNPGILSLWNFPRFLVIFKAHVYNIYNFFCEYPRLLEEKILKTKSIYFQLFNGLRFIVLLSVGFLFVITGIVFMFTYTDDRIQASDIQLSHIENRLEHYFTSTTHYSRLILNSTVVQNSLNLYYRNKEAFLAPKIDLSLEIHKLIYPAPYIYCISVYDRDYNIVVSSERKQYPTDFKDIDVLEGRWITGKKYDASKDVLIDTFSYICPIYDYRSGDLFGYTELVLTDKSITDIYSVSGPKGSYFLLLDEDFNVVSKSDYLNNRPELTTDIIDKLKYNSTSHIFTGLGFINTMFLKPYSWKLVHIIPLYLFIKPAFTISLAFISITTISLGVALYMAKNIAENLSSPIYALVEHTHLVSSGNWNEISYKADSPEMERLISDFNSMIKSQNELKNLLINAEKEKNRLEIDKVNEQIKPHFLYNTLDNIYSLATLDEKETLMELVLNLSKFYRGSLSLGKSFVTLKEELATCTAYLDIMRVRYHYKFDFTISCPGDLLDFTCPKLILLPLAENSIYHGIKGLKYKGNIDIKICEQGDNLLFSVDDNGFGIDIAKLNEILSGNAKDNNHFALKHINRLLKLHYGENYRLNFKNNDIGCSVFFTIKKGSL